MQPIRPPQSTLVDLLDRVLDKGLVIQADLIISLAGVPLIGVNLRAALAGMETMLKYGLLLDWDRAIRAREGALGPPAQAPPPRDLPGGRAVREIRASHLISNGATASWKAGSISFAGRELAWREIDGSETLSIPLSDIAGCVAEQDGVIDVVYRRDGAREVASFAGEGLEELAAWIGVVPVMVQAP